MMILKIHQIKARTKKKEFNYFVTGAKLINILFESIFIQRFVLLLFVTINRITYS